MAKKKNDEEKRGVGPPMKLDKLGPTHKYRVMKMPVELADKAKLAIKAMIGITVSDYLREKVIEASRFEEKGRPFSITACNQVNYDLSTVPWLKAPDVQRLHTYVHYPLQAWEMFKYNCQIQKTNPRAVIIGWLVEIVNLYLRLKKGRNGRGKTR